jgi:hypothetical protein
VRPRSGHALTQHAGTPLVNHPGSFHGPAFENPSVTSVSCVLSTVDLDAKGYGVEVQKIIILLHHRDTEARRMQPELSSQNLGSLCLCASVVNHPGSFHRPAFENPSVTSVSCVLSTVDLDVLHHRGTEARRMQPELSSQNSGALCLCASVVNHPGSFHRPAFENPSVTSISPPCSPVLTLPFSALCLCASVVNHPASTGGGVS